jgi:hypothetical protein
MQQGLYIEEEVEGGSFQCCACAHTYIDRIPIGILCRCTYICMYTYAYIRDTIDTIHVCTTHMDCVYRNLVHIEFHVVWHVWMQTVHGLCLHIAQGAMGRKGGVVCIHTHTYMGWMDTYRQGFSEWCGGWWWSWRVSPDGGPGRPADQLSLPPSFLPSPHPFVLVRSQFPRV